MTDFSQLRAACLAMAVPHAGAVDDRFFELAKPETIIALIDALALCQKSKIDKGYPAPFEECYAAYPPRPGMAKRAAYKAYAARINDGATTAELLAGTRAYAAYCKAKGTEGEYIKSPQTFYGPSEFFRADWTVRRTDGESPRSKKFDPVEHVNKTIQPAGEWDGIIDITPR